MRSDATFRGVLRGGIMAIGGESTGWAITGCDRVEGGAIELEVIGGSFDLESLDGKTVIVTGEIVERTLVERGTIKRLLVRSIKAAE